MSAILIVDDEENIRFSFTSILTDAGYEIISASGLSDARKILNTRQFDVAIVDRLLKSHSGMELAKDIKEVQPHCNTILMSAFPNFKSAAEGFTHQLFAYIQKPVKKDMLCDLVSAAAQNSREKKMSYRLEQQLPQVQKMATMGMFSRGIVHDISNLIIIINGLVAVSRKDLPEDSPLLKNLNLIQQIGNRGSELSSLLLSYAQQNEEQPESIAVQTVMRKAMTWLRIILPDSIEIVDKIGSPEHRIFVCPTQIQQAIINIGINAMHAMKNRDGRFEVCLTPVTLSRKLAKQLEMNQRDSIQISLSDSGCGIDETTIEHIFTPFFSTQAPEMGSGLGLSLTRNIIKKHGGAITVKSRPGQGTRFDLYLPLPDE